MKKLTLVISILLLSNIALNAQFGLDKLKKKAGESKEKKSSSQEASDSPKSVSNEIVQVSEEQKTIEKEFEVYNSYVQGSRTYDMLMGLKKENKTSDHFNELVAKYNSFSVKNEASLRHINRTEEFYTKMATKELPVTEADVNRIFTRSNAFEYNGNSLELKGIKQEKWKVYPDYVIEDLNKIIPELNDQKNYLYKDKTKIDELIKKCEDENKRLEAYKKAGYIKFKEEYDKAFLSTILLEKEAMNDPALCAFVKTKFDAKYGKVIKAVVVDNKWFIDKTSAGIPTYKYTTFNASVKKSDGTCQKHWGRIVMQYEGGGKYGEKYLTYRDFREMSCENVNK